MSGIAGYSYGTIENCTNNADVTALNNHVGGITGRCQSADGIFINCHNTGSVSGGAYVGGIAGSCLGDVTNCTNTGDVTGSAQYGVGGIIGITSDASSVSVTGCYNTGDITSTTTGYAWVGGIVGSFPNQNARGSIENCYNTGAVSATAEGSVCSGGILGGGYGDITNCYNTGTVTGSVNVGAVGGFVNGTVEKAYYLTGSAAAGIGLASVAAIATERTAEQMTGPNALDETNMNLDSDIWTAGGEDTWEYLGENEDGLIAVTDAADTTPEPERPGPQSDAQSDTQSDVQTGQPSNPQNNQQTGDNSNLPVWSMMLLVSGGMLFALLLGKKQKNAE